MYNYTEFVLKASNGKLKMCYLKFMLVWDFKLFL
jgi:hypothetical protein